MKAALYQYRPQAGCRKHEGNDDVDEQQAQLVLCFGARSLLDAAMYEQLRARFPAARIVTCSTAGEIFNTEVNDDTLSVVVCWFENTTVAAYTVHIDDYTDSYTAGRKLLEQFPQEDLAYLLVLSDGSKVNGSELVNGLNEGRGQRTLITGGLAGDGHHFQSTLVGLDKAPQEGIIAGIGLYGKHIQVQHGSMGGWEMFGLEKTVTRSEGNLLYEIEGKSALELYKKYLGPEADALPGSALLFPLSVTLPASGEQVVRTILSINEAEGSMLFAGDIPQGAQVRFMKANFDKITHAASDAAFSSLEQQDTIPRLALLISCVGRKLILQSRTDEEVEAVNEVFGGKTLLSGFYSYGELSPLVAGGNCQLHNQTMTITTFYEAE